MVIFHLEALEGLIFVCVHCLVVSDSQLDRAMLSNPSEFINSLWQESNSSQTRTICCQGWTSIFAKSPFSVSDEKEAERPRIDPDVFITVWVRFYVIILSEAVTLWATEDCHTLPNIPCSHLLPKPPIMSPKVSKHLLDKCWYSRDCCPSSMCVRHHLEDAFVQLLMIISAVHSLKYFWCFFLINTFVKPSKTFVWWIIYSWPLYLWIIIGCLGRDHFPFSISTGIQDVGCSFLNVSDHFFPSDKNTPSQVHLIMSNQDQDHCPVQVNDPSYDSGQKTKYQTAFPIYYGRLLDSISESYVAL